MRDSMHIVVSPHQDDAVLSLGAVIAAWRAGGAPVCIMTVFSGGPDGLVSPVVAEDRSRYAGDPVVLRADEDRRAAHVLDARLITLDLPEVIYRQRPNGTPRAGTLDDIFGPLEESDDSVIADVAGAIGAALHGHDGEVVLHGPRGTGNHIDHVIVRRALEDLEDAYRVETYDDLPYAIDDAPTHSWPVAVTSAHLDQWIAAIECYATQIPILFRDRPSWRDDFRRWAHLARWT